MTVVHHDHGIAEVGQLRGSLLHDEQMAMTGQQIQQQGVLAAQRLAVAHGNFQAGRGSAAIQQALELGQAGWRIQLELGQILVINADFLGGDTQQAVDCRLIITPGVDQLSGHGV